MSNDWSSELDGLNGIELGGLQQGIEVDENWSWSTSGWQVLELVDRLLVSQESAWGISGNSCGSCVVAGGKFLVKHQHEDIVSSWEVESLSEFEAELLVAWDVTGGVDVWNEVVLLDVDREDLSSSVDDDHTISVGVSCGHEAELVSDSLSEEKSGSGDLVHVEESHLGDDEEDSVLGAVLHEHWEVTILLHLEIGRALDLLLAWSWISNFHDMKFLRVFTGFLLTEAEE